MNIEGVVRDLALFEPPIDPALLVKAKALGVKLDEVLKPLAGPAPMYRFVRLHAKAMEFAGFVMDLGRSVLAAMEKRDGEALSLLRQGHEQNLLEAEREVRKLAIDEAKQTLAGLREGRKVIERRFSYYDTIQHVSTEESTSLALNNTSGAIRAISQYAMSLASALRLIPETTASLPPAVTFGGSNIGESIKIAGAVSDYISTILATEASSLATTGGWKRRSAEWRLQRDLAQRELEQNEKQLAAQEIRVAIAEQELRNLDLRRSQSQEVETFLRDKFTSQELYDWMVGQLAAEHYRAYQLAFDMAKRAEQSYQLERGDTSTFIRFGAWDSLKKGLMAGERLLQDLRAMDAAYMVKAEREKEIVKHISLAELDATKLTTLRSTGTTTFDLNEYLFDADYPGQYFRRIKTVALSIPTIKASQDSVQAELQLDSSKIRISSLVDGGGYSASTPAAALAPTDLTKRKRLVTSSGEQDTGLFETNLRDDMLLPFEGAGVISGWTLRVDKEQNRFPLHRISDVVLHLRYTAKDGGDSLRTKALTFAKSGSGLVSRTRMLSARRDLGLAWANFLKLTGGKHTLEVPLGLEDLVSFFGVATASIKSLIVSATFGSMVTNGHAFVFDLFKPGSSSADATGKTITAASGVGEPASSAYSTSFTVASRKTTGFLPWKIEATPSAQGASLTTGSPLALKPDALEDLWFTFTYEDN